MKADPHVERRARARRRAEARRQERLDELTELDARYTQVAKAAALQAATRGHGPRAVRRAS